MRKWAGTYGECLLSLVDYYYVLHVCMFTEIGKKSTNRGAAADAVLAPLSGHICWIVLMVCSRVRVLFVACQALVDILN